MKILIKNAWIITNNAQNQVIPHGYLIIENDTIQTVQAGDYSGIMQFDKVLDVQGRVVMPGLVNAHMHCYSTFARGMSLGCSAPSHFVEILEKLWWRLDKKLRTQDLYLTTLIPVMEGIRSGVTTFIDHHASPYCVHGCLDELQKAFETVGMRGILCYEVSDRDGEKIAQQGIDENIRFIEKCNANPNSLVKGTFGLHASFTVGKETLSHAVEASHKLQVGIHTHLAEDQADQTLTKKRDHQSVVQRLYDFGALGRKTITAHAVCVDQTERKLLAETKTWVVHNPRSNMNNAVGAMDLLGHLADGVNVCLGTDGMAGSIWPDLRTAAVIHKHEHRDPRVVWSELATLLQNNYKLAELFFPKTIGQLIPGAYADIVEYSYYPPTPLVADNLLGHLLFGFSHVQARTVMISGRIVLNNFEFVGINEAEIANHARCQAESFWRHFHS